MPIPNLTLEWGNWRNNRTVPPPIYTNFVRESSNNFTSFFSNDGFMNPYITDSNGDVVDIKWISEKNKGDSIGR
ncbi:MAG: hypothetical protein N2B06_04865 [Clostridium sp.]